MEMRMAIGKDLEGGRCIWGHSDQLHFELDFEGKADA